MGRTIIMMTVRELRELHHTLHGESKVYVPASHVGPVGEDDRLIVLVEDPKSVFFRNPLTTDDRFVFLVETLGATPQPTMAALFCH